MVEYAVEQELKEATTPNIFDIATELELAVAALEEYSELLAPHGAGTLIDLIIPKVKGAMEKLYKIRL